MASTTALFTGLSGLISNSRRLDTIGNNIANVNTVAFKSNRMTFTPTFSRNFSLGTAPNAVLPVGRTLVRSVLVSRLLERSVTSVTERSV